MSKTKQPEVTPETEEKHACTICGDVRSRDKRELTWFIQACSNRFGLDEWRCAGVQVDISFLICSDRPACLAGAKELGHLFNQGHDVAVFLALERAKREAEERELIAAREAKAAEKAAAKKRMA